jgi:hypothetical protein
LELIHNNGERGRGVLNRQLVDGMDCRRLSHVYWIPRNPRRSFNDFESLAPENLKSMRSKSRVDQFPTPTPTTLQKVYVHAVQCNSYWMQFSAHLSHEAGFLGDGLINVNGYYSRPSPEGNRLHQAPSAYLKQVVLVVGLQLHCVSM